MRLGPDSARGAPITIEVDGQPASCFEGETIVAAMLCAGHIRFGVDAGGRPRGLFCLMGTCCGCLVDLPDEKRRVRACLHPVDDGLRVRTIG